MASNTRRAAGTQTFTDVLKIWFAGMRPDAAADLADFRSGATLQVSCVLRAQGEASRGKFGTLSLTRGESVIWRGRDKNVVTLGPPVTLTESSEKAVGPKFTAFDLDCAAGSFVVQIPTLDVRLVKTALGAS
ncbi:hypothetical protein H5U98_07560 [Mycolicibacterium boenickei]|uniref:Uncharacterized protein n=1 Tax=Mycolicibacterium boenickei TaxID=146017 RepID=A0AAX3A0S8_9MYCO|nr:hypothetical protein [Mycolicibacterium boenickei]PEG58427.1 hypothetical protein CQY21_22380 [Mycolicibacterium boenickei]UNC01233.1 hypothetical protein H5U98_07560 [Mycolicibacterium boenickei]BBX91093.1 hypothetical protein MBOE_27420 [Mycolicibacterium boenickei]